MAPWTAGHWSEHEERTWKHRTLNSYKQWNNSPPERNPTAGPGIEQGILFTVGNDIITEQVDWLLINHER